MIPPHDWLHITTPLATGKKPPGEKTNFPPSKTSECAGVLGSSSPPCLCQQHSPPCSGLAEATRHPVLSPVRYSTVVCWMQPEAALRFTRSISHILTHLRGAGMLHRQPTQSQRSGDELSMETSQEPRVSIFIYYFFFSFSLFKSYLFHVRWSHSIPPLPLCPRVRPGRWDGVHFSLRGAFCFHDHTNCNKLYKKTLASPEVWQQPFSARAKGRRLSLPLLLHHTCPSASSSSAPGVFGPFSQAAFSTAFSTPVLLAASFASLSANFVNMLA